MMRIFLIVTCLLGCSALASAQFYTDYSREERIRLSREYYTLGTYLAGTGREQGAWYIKLAYELNPDFLPDVLNGEVRNEVNDLIRFRFTRMICAFIARDFPHFFRYFDADFYSGNEKKQYRHWEWMERIDKAMDKTDTSGLSPFFIFDLEHMKIEPAGQYSVLTIKSKLFEFPELAPIFPESQYYLLRTMGGKWVISALFPQYPSDTLLKEYESLRDDSGTRNFFLSSVKLFIARDINALLPNFHDTVYLLPMKNKVSKMELELTFKGLFNDEETPQTGINPDYTMINNSLSVEILEGKPAFSEEADINGQFLLLTVNSQAGKDILPAFWSSYKKYYILLQNGKYSFFAFE
jgi:hypothetical protein